MAYAFRAKTLMLGLALGTFALGAAAHEHGAKPACYDELGTPGQEIFDFAAELRKDAMADGEVTTAEQEATQEAVRSEVRSKVVSGDLNRTDARATVEAAMSCMQGQRASKAE